MSDHPKRVRLVRVRVQPEFVIDDGETLTPLPPEAVGPRLGVAGVRRRQLRPAIAAIQAQIDATDALTPRTRSARPRGRPGTG